MLTEFIGSLNLASLFPGDENQRNLPARSLFQGLGSGSVAGLNLKAMDDAAYGTTGVNGVEGNSVKGSRFRF